MVCKGDKLANTNYVSTKIVVHQSDWTNKSSVCALDSLIGEMKLLLSPALTVTCFCVHCQFSSNHKVQSMLYTGDETHRAEFGGGVGGTA